MKSFIPWIGGKSQLKNVILEHFPSKMDRYIEVFGGAGNLLFARDTHAPLEIFNDIDGQLINLYKCIKYHCEELQRELRLEDTIPLNSREMFDDYKEQLACRGLTDIQRAARYYYIIRISYGADRHSFSCNRRAMDSTIDYLSDIQSRLKNVVIENKDFQALIRTYDRPEALIYADPPYYTSEKYYSGFVPEDHQRLYDSLNKARGLFILSYNDIPYIRDLYKGYNITPVSRANSLAPKDKNTQKKYRELIISNF